MTGATDYTVRRAAYDLRKLRGKHLVTKPGRTRRYQLTPQAAGTIAALLTLREHAYEILRIDMQRLFDHLGITTEAAA